MNIQLSERVQSIQTSSTLLVASKARALINQGKPVLDLGVGEPDFDTPVSIKKAGIEAIEKGFTKYTPIPGYANLRAAIQHKFKQDNQLHYEVDQIMVSCGGKQTFFNLAQAFLNPGDEVIIPAPYWVSYPDMVMLAGAKPIFVFAGIEQNFKITPDQIEAAITPKTKLLVINSPSNPTGMAYTRKELQDLAAVLLRYPDILIATDDMYEYILWSSEPFCNIVMACPALYDRTMILHGVSKTYAMTGWRIGFAAGPKILIDAMIKIQSQSTSGACSISQKAAENALTGDQACVKKMVDAFQQRHQYLVEALNAIEGIQCPEADGTFYAFPAVQGLIDRLVVKYPEEKLQNDHDLAEFLLQKAFIATVPGGGFGAPGYLRLSFATGLEVLKEAVQRLRDL